MGWGRSGRSLMVVAGLVTVAACSSGDDTSSPAPTDAGSEPTQTTSADAGSVEGDAAVADVATTTSDTAAAPAASGERSAVITIDGETTLFTMDDIEFSNVEGVDDVTFEDCNPDFFGSGRFYALGYAVDDSGEILVGDDGGPAGFIQVDLPPDDWEAAERDAPGFEIDLHGLEIEIATPEEASGGTMSWTIEDTTAAGTAVFVDGDSTYTVDFELECSGAETVDAEDLPAADDDEGDDGGTAGLPAAGGVGSYTDGGESFDGVDVYRCEPFSFGSDPHPDDLSLLAFRGGSNGLSVDISHSEGFTGSGAETFDQIDLQVNLSRSGDAGLFQFEGRARNDADGNWYLGDPLMDDAVQLDGPPFVIEGDRIVGELAGLEQTWPDEGAAVADVTFDLAIPTEIIEC